MSNDHEKHVKANIRVQKKLKLDPTQELVEKVYDKVEKSRMVITKPRKPQLPNRLIILSVEWDIIYRNNSYEVDLDKQGKYWGQTDFENNKIRILKAGRKKEAIWNTLFHEILHVLFHHLNIDDILGSKEENVTVALSSALNDFFWRNFNAR